MFNSLWAVWFSCFLQQASSAGNGQLPGLRNPEACRDVPFGGPFTSRRREMDWNLIEGNWKQAQGKIKEKWGKLTEDDLTKINGQREQLEGILQQRYGLAKEIWCARTLMLG